MRLRTALILAVSILSLAGFANSAAAATSMPAEGTFENCNIDRQMQTCIQRLGVMHSGGIQVVAIASQFVSPAGLATYAAAAHALGMSVMWELSDPNWWQSPGATSMDGYYSAFVSACGCTQNGQLLGYLVHWLGNLPGTYGYYAADDSVLPSTDQAAVASYVSTIKHADPSHTVMISSFGLGQAQQYEGMADVIGKEMYPVKSAPLMPASSNQSAWDSIGRTATSTQQMADAAGKPSAFILQAFTWGDNIDDGRSTGVCTSADTTQTCYPRLRYPTAAEQLQLRNEILLHAHPKLIMWWSFFGTYGDVTGDTYSIYPSGAEAAQRWQGLEAAIQAPSPAANTSASKTVTRHHRRRAHAASKRRTHRHSVHRRHHRRHHHRAAHRRHARR